MVQILCAHVNGKMRPAKTILGMEGEEDKGKWWRG
jgi:hypothetical protein